MEMVISNKADLRKLSQFQAQAQDIELSCSDLLGRTDIQQ